uniref:HhH-GPD domain-containing protein n=1 Tax=viral metagenome TaxID=1070528 RepID=A0A6H1ZIE3_9ZZZZ
MLELERFLLLRAELVAAGYGDEIAWAESVQLVADPLSFWSEYAWVVLNSGMKNQVARGIWDRVRPRVLAGGRAAEVFGHVGKAAGIDKVYAEREALFAAYQSADDKLEFLRALPWIGPITCKHLAKNYGFDCAKSDRHLVRIAGAEGVDSMCQRLAAATGMRVATVDLVVWRAANLGLL